MGIKIKALVEEPVDRSPISAERGPLDEHNIHELTDNSSDLSYLQPSPTGAGSFRSPSHERERERERETRDFGTTIRRHVAESRDTLVYVLKNLTPLCHDRHHCNWNHDYY